LPAWTTRSPTSAVLAVVADALQRRLVLLRKRGRRVDRQAQVMHPAVAQRIHPGVHGERLSPRPGLAHDGRFADVDHLLQRIELAQAVVPDLVVPDRLDDPAVLVLDVL